MVLSIVVPALWKEMPFAVGAVWNEMLSKICVVLSLLGSVTFGCSSRPGVEMLGVSAIFVAVWILCPDPILLYCELPIITWSRVMPKWNSINH